MLPRDSGYFLGKLRQLHMRMRDHLRQHLLSQDPSTLATVSSSQEGDTLYEIDIRSEDLLREFCREWSAELPFALIAEGVPGNGWTAFPEGSSADDASFLLIVDPIDGTRQLMYDKRSAWLLSGIAPNRGHATTLADISLAMQTELPTTRHYLAYHLWAVPGRGTRAELHDLIRNTVSAITLTPSRSSRLEHGFASFAKFFPANKAELAEIECRLYESVVGNTAFGNPLIFDDQYTSSGGQLFELVAGHDRFIADLRPLLSKSRSAGTPPPLCAHPYDLCTEMIAREAGVVVTDAEGKPLSPPLDIREDVAWIGYANTAIRELVEPVLLPMLREL